MTAIAEAPAARARPRPALRGAAWRDGLVLGLVILLAGLARLPSLDRYTISFPEGIRAEQLLLMAAGYRPCVEIFCNQGPLLFYALYPTFILFGQGLEGVRSGVVLFSLVGIGGTYWVGHLLAGRLAATIAALLVALSPTYLKFSRLGLAEVPAVAPAVLAVGAAIAFNRHGRDRWLVGAGLLVALSLLLKPVTLAVCVPVGLSVLLRPRRRWRNVAVLTVVTAAAIAIPTLLIGFSEILEQVVAFRLRSRVAEGRGTNWNLSRIVEELAGDRPGLFAFGLAGVVVMLARLRGQAVPIVAWAVASPLLLLVHTPLHGKHIVTLIPPVALLAGGGAAVAWRIVREPVDAARGKRWLSRLGAGAVALGAVAYLAYLPATVARDHTLMFDPEPLEGDPAAYWYADAVRLLGGSTGPREMIVTDHPYLTFEARRLVPPQLVESSVTRILASSLTAEDAIQEATRYEAVGVLLWADKLTTLKPFKAWVDRAYVPVRVYAADGEATPTFYVRSDRVTAARTTLSPLTAQPSGVELEGGLRLAAYGLDRSRVAPGDVTALNMAWEAIVRPAADYRVVLQLRGDDQIVWRSDELPLAGLGPGTTSWQPDQGVTLSALVRVPRTLRPADYALSIRLYDPRGRRFVDPLGQRDAAPQTDPKGVTLATLTVTGSDR